ncbi:multidrug resistance protein [Bacillus sp. J14TS2]|uniref:MFS transporter n=1 Tax=Bacillus sp. J14TS2 TaxID=2807188 RepID=UPI001B1D6340|nr:MFS transporter [Bacillus sp. J14TS2]GIN73413.1 multidrug resistance protein [Bacillus sp. J14TS2]
MKKIIIVLCVLSFLVGFDLIVTVPMLPAISESLNINMEISGILFTAYALAYALFGLVTGSISDRIDKKKILLVGIIIFSVATFVTGLSSSLFMLISFRILAGLGAAFIQPTVYSIVGEVIEYEQRGKVMGAVTAALILPTVIGIPIAGFITDLFNWRVPFFTIGVTSILMFVVTWTVIPSFESTSSSSTVKMIKKALSNRTITLTLLISFMYYGGLEAIFSIIGIYYNQNFGLSASYIGGILLIAGIASVLGSIMSGKVMDKPHNKKRLLLAVSVLSLFSILFLTINDKLLYISIALNVIWSFSYAFGQNVINTYMSNQNDQIRTTVMSLNSSAMYFGATVLSIISITVLNAFSFIAVGIVCAIAYLLSALVTFKLQAR